jgi:phosphate transport system substrate-binding protein
VVKGDDNPDLLQSALWPVSHVTRLSRAITRSESGCLVREGLKVMISKICDTETGLLLAKAKQILAGKFSVFCVSVALLFNATTAIAEPIRGAGSTFAAPIISQWGKNYQTMRADGGDFISPDWTVDYELVGSLAGMMRLIQPDLDFAATDTPMSSDELAKRGLKQFPIVIGGVAIVTNIDGVAAGRLRLTGPLLSDIFMGKISNWSDPALRAANPDLALPDLKINVRFRKDGSGTTSVVTQYLSQVSAEWKSKIGSDTLVAWPVGNGAEGTQGLIRAVGATKGAIGYIEYGQVARAGLAFAELQNSDGRFVRPDAISFQAAANAVDWKGAKDFDRQLTNQSGAAAYPIAAATFAVVPTNGRSAGRIARVHDLFRLAYDKGGSEAIALGYVPLPPALIEQVKAYWASSTQPGG